MMQILQAISEPVLIGLSLAICLAVPKIWVQTILNKRDIERQDKKVNGLFERVDGIMTDVSYIRGKLDGP